MSCIRRAIAVIHLFYKRCDTWFNEWCAPMFIAAVGYLNPASDTRPVRVLVASRGCPAWPLPKLLEYYYNTCGRGICCLKLPIFSHKPAVETHVECVKRIKDDSDRCYCVFRLPWWYRWISAENRHALIAEHLRNLKLSIDWPAIDKDLRMNFIYGIGDIEYGVNHNETFDTVRRRLPRRQRRQRRQRRHAANAATPDSKGGHKTI